MVVFITRKELINIIFTLDGIDVEINSDKMEDIYEDVKAEINKRVEDAISKNDAQYILFALSAYNDISRRLFERVLGDYKTKDVIKILKQ